MARTLAEIDAALAQLEQSAQQLNQRVTSIKNATDATLDTIQQSIDEAQAAFVALRMRVLSLEGNGDQVRDVIIEFRATLRKLTKAAQRLDRGDGAKTTADLVESVRVRGKVVRRRVAARRAA